MKKFALAAMAALLASTASYAGPLTWNLTDVTFDDGGTASGWFTYDADTNALSDWAITTTDGSVLSGATYTPAGYGYAYNGYFLFSLGSPYLLFTPASALTDAGGTVALSQNGYGSYECNNCYPYRFASGSLTTETASVPEPASWAFMLGGFAMVGGAMRSRRRAAVSFG